MIIDETHTICTGVGGYTKEYNLKPDMVVVGKTIAAGIPAGAYGFTEELGKKVAAEFLLNFAILVASAAHWQQTH